MAESAESPDQIGLQGVASGILSFVEYRSQLDVYQHALDSGLSDADYVRIVSELDAGLVESSGVGFRQTPMVEVDTPLERRVVGKVETANVSGSHKARHLFGLLVWLTIDESAGKQRPQELAIASCGNAALGAATLAHAVDRSLRVFVPADANPVVLAELERLGSTVEVCQRQPGQSGDPCMAGLSKAIDAGSEAFTVQGPTSPHVIDGGRTIGLELAAQLRQAKIEATDIYIQVGGGALGAATMDGLVRSGLSLCLHPVQPQTAHPYVAMWNRLQERFADTEGFGVVDGQPLSGDALRSLIAGNSDVMTPWPGTPSSVASGILDDITYDWQPLLYHQVTSGGWPVLASEEDFVGATELLADQITPRPDATGAASLAGLLADPLGDPAGAGPVVVLITGADRAPTAQGANA